MDITNLYAYRIEIEYEILVGLVKAESRDEAREKVKKAYLEHNPDYTPNDNNIIKLKEIADGDSWFSDNPDVIEVDGFIW